MITAQLATYPARIDILPQVINSLLPQVDRLNVMLNGYSDNQAARLQSYFADPNRYFVQEFERLQFIILDNSMTDAAKFYNIEKAEPGYLFTCDDDILYPPDYVEKSIAKIEEYNRKYIITYHGRVWNDHPITSFYRDRKEMYRCIQGFEGDHFVDCAGDGVCAWHTDTIKMRYEYCELPNMSQLWFALACNKAGVKQIAIGHPEGWLLDICPDQEETIWYKYNEDDGVQTKLVNERWKPV
jgi:hypothetical protein